MLRSAKIYITIKPNNQSLVKGLCLIKMRRIMRKILSSVALAMAIMFAGSCYAQNDTVPTHQQSQKFEKKGKKKGKKEWKGEKGKKGEMRGKRGVEGPKFDPFQGIQLTETQQKQLQALREGLGPVKLDKSQKEKVYGNDVQKPKKENLTPEQKQQMKEQKKKMKEEQKTKKREAKKKYLDGVKSILSPEQYVVFLENVYMVRG